MEIEIVIAECPYCGCKRHSLTVEDALEKLNKHICITTLADREIMEILVRIVDGTTRS